MFNEDPHISSALYANQAKNLRIVMEQTSPFAVGVTTTIGDKVCSFFKCTEAFIDSTYKTNRRKLELFTVIVCVFAVGIPVGYLLLEKSNEEQQRMAASLSF